MCKYFSTDDPLMTEKLDHNLTLLTTSNDRSILFMSRSEMMPCKVEGLGMEGTALKMDSRTEETISRREHGQKAPLCQSPLCQSPHLCQSPPPPPPEPPSAKEFIKVLQSASKCFTEKIHIDTPCATKCYEKQRTYWKLLREKGREKEHLGTVKHSFTKYGSASQVCLISDGPLHNTRCLIEHVQGQTRAHSQVL